jgi:membrane protein
MGEQAAALLQTVLRSAADQSIGTLAGLVGLATLVVTASGVFSEMQSALNAVWRARPQGTAVSRLVRVRLVGLGLVGALGFLLVASLVISAALTALDHWLDGVLPAASLLLQLLTFVVSFSLLAVIFAAIYKVLPDRALAWRDVLVGAIVTAFLFTVGKSLIGLYLGSSSMASSYGAAGGLMILLVWVYYSAQIFLLGAEFTKIYATRHGSFRETGLARTVDRTVEKRPTARQKRPLAQAK